MSVATLRPNATTSNTGTVTGAATAHAALSDDSDSSYVTFAPSQAWLGGFTDLTLPAGAVVRSLTLRVRCARVTTSVDMSMAVMSPATAPYTWSDSGVTNVSWTPATSIFGMALVSTALSDATVDAVVAELRNSSASGSLRIYEAYLNVTYVEQPVTSVTAPAGTVTDTNLPSIIWMPA